VIYRIAADMVRRVGRPVAILGLVYGDDIFVLGWLWLSRSIAMNATRRHDLRVAWIGLVSGCASSPNNDISRLEVDVGQALDEDDSFLMTGRT